jgi:hypothetical protein
LGWDKIIDALRELAASVGVSGAALLIMVSGIALRLPKLLAILRDFVKDWQEYSLKRRELLHRIERDRDAFALEIEEKRRQLAKPREEIGR